MTSFWLGFASGWGCSVALGLFVYALAVRKTNTYVTHEWPYYERPHGPIDWDDLGDR